MAGLEQLEIHSRSYLVRWINISGGHTISWSIQPHKKSINFGIFKHPSASTSGTPSLPQLATRDQSPAPGEASSTRPRSGSRNDNTRVMEKLQGIGMKSVSWTGRCDGDKVTMGMYDVPEGEGGMYGLVFDNTFSKQASKTATFVLMTYPTDSPPKSGHHMRFSESASASTASLGGTRNQSLPRGNVSTDSLPQGSGGAMKAAVLESRPKTSYAKAEPGTVGRLGFYTGVLHKKRRKKNQGYARRFFSLDFTTSTLSYYKDRQSSALRGAIPLLVAAVATNDKSREITVDSGAEVWHLRASNQSDFAGWKDALQAASQSSHLPLSPAPDRSFSQTTIIPDPRVSEAERREWAVAETLIGRLSGSRDAVKTLAKDTDPKYLPATVGLGVNRSAGSAVQSPSEVEGNDYFQDERLDRSSFWRRNRSSGAASPSSLFRRSVSAQLAIPSPSSVPQPMNSPLEVPKKKSSQNLRQLAVQPQPAPPGDYDDVHNRCMEILRDLDSLVVEFGALLTQNKQRRTHTLERSTTRTSMDSMSDEEFFDAKDDGATVKSQLLDLQHDSDEFSDSKEEIASDAGSESSDDEEGIGLLDRKKTEADDSIFPTRPKFLTPLPLDRIRRRTTVPPPKVSPPSLIGFLRKNVGKDLSTVSMPVSANEPISLLQRFAEHLEYSELLDAAAHAPTETGERILHVAAFAISSFSCLRIKERAIRKPFNPMLGETYELVREDKSFRFVAEKVSHRPVRMACQADGRNWTFLQSPMPVQKFWGKSAELNTNGRARLLIYPSPHTASADNASTSTSTSTPPHAELYSWTIATSFLRNVVAGEKYVEPVGTMTVLCETSGAKAVVTFKAAGMFSGRSEDATVQAFDGRSGTPLSLGLTGRWTSSLSFVGQDGSDVGRPPLWSVGSLADRNKPERCYGFTEFAAQLNEVTTIEKGKLPPTDSRLRPDQRAAEDGDLDRAEGVKARLEERQRARRRVMEDHGEEWKPRWFTTAEGEKEREVDEGETVWRLKGGKDGYWDARARSEWAGVMEVFQG